MSQVAYGRWHSSSTLVGDNRWQHKFQFFFRYLPVLIFIACFHKTGLDFLQLTGVIRFTLKTKNALFSLSLKFLFHFHLFPWKEICELCLYSRPLMFISLVKLIKVRERLPSPPAPRLIAPEKGSPNNIASHFTKDALSISWFWKSKTKKLFRLNVTIFFGKW